MKKNSHRSGESKMKRIYIRNWIICIVSLVLAILAYKFM